MQQRTMGKDGPQIPVLGLGTWPLGGGMGAVDEARAIDTIHAAINQGITLLDTAQAYLNSEAVIGKALRGGYRERCFLATKVSRDYSPEAIERAMENSLRQLNVDYVDLYQIHSWDPQYPIADSMAAMARLQEQGKTRYLGVSNFNVPQMQEARATAPFHANQIAYSLFDRHIEAEIMPFCEREGIGILAHSPLAKGLLTGKYTPETTFPPDDERSNFAHFQGETFARYLSAADELAEIAGDHGLNLVQLAIAWTLQRSAVTCVLVGAKSPEQVAEHVRAAEVTFSDDALARIDSVLAGAPALR